MKVLRLMINGILQRRHWFVVGVVPALLLAICRPTLAGGEQLRIDSPMFEEPHLEISEHVLVFSPGLKDLWLQALERPEADLQRQAADAIALAHGYGMQGLSETVDALAAALQKPDQHPVVKYSAGRALIALDARDKADVLWKQAQSGGLELAQFIEPALLEWDYEPIREVWLGRLDRGESSRQRLLLAVRGLGRLQEEQATDRLLEFVSSRETVPSVRLEAARALANIESEGLVDAARSLAGDKAPSKLVDRLAAASLLKGHENDETRALLAELALDPEPAVAAIALTRLLQIDRPKVVELFDRLSTSRGAKVRLLAARSLAAVPSAEHLTQLAPMLDDHDPQVRSFVRDTLLAAAADEAFGDLIREMVDEALQPGPWRQIEQAAMMVVHLDYKPAADRLVEHLESNRREVMVAAAWALRRLAIPETLPDLLDRAQRVNDRKVGHNTTEVAASEQLAQIFQAFGQMKYMESEPLMRKYVPLFAPGTLARAAAVWALGHLHAGRRGPRSLTRQLEGRLAHVSGLIREDPRVRRMAAISLGRIRSPRSRQTLTEFAGWDTLPGVASNWALYHMRGEPMPVPPVVSVKQSGWFLDVAE